MRKVKLCNECIKDVHRDNPYKWPVMIENVSRKQCDNHKLKTNENEREF